MTAWLIYLDNLLADLKYVEITNTFELVIWSINVDEYWKYLKHLNKLTIGSLVIPCKEGNFTVIAKVLKSSIQNGVTENSTNINSTNSSTKLKE